MKFDQLKAKYKDSILEIAKQRKIDNVRVFGSIANGNQNNYSDIDFLVHMTKEADLLDLSGFHLDLEELLNCKIDVIPDNSIHWSIKDKILSEAVELS
jgi:predicted nucleotidyltransferase